MIFFHRFFLFHTFKNEFDFFIYQEAVKIKKKQYNPESLLNAFNAVEKGMSVYAAARNYGVQETTLRDRTLGHVSVTEKTASFVFNDSTEKEIVDHVKYMSSIDYGYSKSDVLYLASDLAVSLGKQDQNDKPLSNKWLYSFMKKWPDLNTTKPQRLSMLRAKFA